MTNTVRVILQVNDLESSISIEMGENVVFLDSDVYTVTEWVAQSIRDQLVDAYEGDEDA